MADIFISYSTKDEAVANVVCEELEKKGLKCWIAPRNIPAGGDWMSTIIEAIKSCKIFLVIYSANSAQSNQVPREVAVAISEANYIIPYKIDNTPFSGTYEYSLATCHWIQANPASGVYKIDDLVASVSVQLSKSNGGTYIENYTVNNITGSNVSLSGGEVNVAPSPQIVAAPVRDNVPRQPVQPPNGTYPQQPRPQYATAQPIPPQQTAQPPKKEKKSNGCLVAFIVVVIVLAFFAVIGYFAASCASNSFLGMMPNVSHTVIEGDGYEMERHENCYYFPADFSPAVFSSEYKTNYAELYYGNNSKQYFSMGSNDYYSGAVLIGQSSDSYIEIDVSKYNLEGFSFYYGHTDVSERNDVEIHIYADDLEIGTPTAKWGALPSIYTYNLAKNSLNNVDKIKIAIKGDAKVAIGIGNLLFFEKGNKPSFTAPAPEISSKPARVPGDIDAYANFNADIYPDVNIPMISMGGLSYDDGIILQGKDGATVVFDVGGKYNGLQFTIGRVLEEKNNSKDELTVKIYLNGRAEASETITVKWTDVPEVFTMKFSDYPYQGETAEIIGDQIKKVAVVLESNKGGIVGISDFIFFGTNEPSASGKTNLSTVDAYVGKDIEPYFIGKDAVIYNGLNSDKSFTIDDKDSYIQGLVLPKGDNGVAMFNTRNKYSTLHFSVGCAAESEIVLILTVGDEEQTIKVAPGSGLTEFNIDLSDGEVSNVSFYVEKGTAGITDIYFSGK